MLDLIISTLTTCVFGLYAGSLLTEGVILVPYWRRMSPEDFFSKHSEMGPSLFKYFAPLTTSAVLLYILTAIVIGGRHIFAASLCVSALIIFFLYFKKPTHHLLTIASPMKTLKKNCQNGPHGIG